GVGRPEVGRLFHACGGRAVAVDRLARVLTSVADDWESVVRAGANRVDLVPASWSVLACPQLSGARVKRHALIVSNAVREDLRTRAGSSHEWIVAWHRTVGVDPEHLSHEAVELLRLRPPGGIDAHAGRNHRRPAQ